MPRKSADAIGRKFGRLTAITLLEERAAGRQMQCLCKCDCGKEKIVLVSYLNSGRVVSCGCSRTERITKMKYNHGDHGSPEYRVWQSMIRRCTDETHKNFDDYRGRGITICDRWLESYSNFLGDMGRRPSLKYTLERIDNDGNYNKSNCKWADKVEQARNRRVRKNNKFGVTGVSFNKLTNKYSAGISVDRKWVIIGTYSHLEDAIAARKEAENKYWGKSS